MVIVLFLLLNIFPFAFQMVPTAFYCDVYLREVYVVENGNRRKIHNGISGDYRKPFYFKELDAVPGDLIGFLCQNGAGETYGAGCFFLENTCHCYDFDANKEISSNGYGKTAYFNDIACNMTIHPLVEQLEGNYYYEHYIPLYANKILCNNYNTVLYIPGGVDYSLQFSNYIKADFSIKNVEVSITSSNYVYFKLNNKKLERNQIFNVSNNLTFNLNIAQKIRVSFRNYGKLVEGTKDCAFYIRVCHERCSECFDSEINDDNYQCKKCKEGYYLIEKTNNCKTIQEMKESKYYLDTREKIFKKCYSSCHRCDANSIEGYHNCTQCEDNYHYIYNEKYKKNCIHESTKPLNTYLDTNTNTYELCYERCIRCSQKGDITNNNT